MRVGASDVLVVTMEMTSQEPQAEESEDAHAPVGTSASEPSDAPHILALVLQQFSPVSLPATKERTKNRPCPQELLQEDF